MTRAREGGGAKAVFRRARHQRLPATEQGGKERTEEENKSSKSAKKESEDAPKETEEETSRPRGNKEGKPRGKPAKRNRTDAHGEKMAVERKRAIGRRARKHPRRAHFPFVG